MYSCAATHYAVAHIESLGGGVQHDLRWGTTAYEVVDLDDIRATDSDLYFVRQLAPHIGIYLRNTKITDKGLEYLHGIVVEEIDLRGTSVTKRGVEKLRRSIKRQVVISYDGDPHPLRYKNP